MSPEMERDDPDRAELDALRPYLDLAREIRAAVERFIDDDAATAESLRRALDAIPEREVATVASSVFSRLGAAEQWAVLERVVGDERLTELIAQARASELDEQRRQAESRAVAATARSAGELDLAHIGVGTPVTVLLFRPSDVMAVLGRGADSDVCARELRLVATAGPGRFRVVADRFNPRRGLFVTAAYDESVWQSERLIGHSEVEIGALGGDGAVHPVVRPGARLDMVVDGSVREGRLQVGAMLLDDVDVFAVPR